VTIYIHKKTNTHATASATDSLIIANEFSCIYIYIVHISFAREKKKSLSTKSRETSITQKVSNGTDALRKRVASKK
jgi:hypothetical protein